MADAHKSSHKAGNSSEMLTAIKKKEVNRRVVYLCPRATARLLEGVSASGLLSEFHNFTKSSKLIFRLKSLSGKPAYEVSKKSFQKLNTFATSNLREVASLKDFWDDCNSEDPSDACGLLAVTKLSHSIES